MDTVKYIVDKYGEPFKKIEGVKRVDFYSDFRELGFTEGVEIGVHQGSNARAMFNAIPNLKLHCVDCWSEVEGRKRGQQKRYYRRMKNTLEKERINGQANIIKKWSMDAVKHFKRESVDFVYIDANHNYDFVMQDIIEWSRIVRMGGIVSGHDYHYKRPHCGVLHAVQNYTSFHHLNYYWLDDDKKRPSRTKRGKTQTNNTWFFIKGWKT